MSLTVEALAEELIRLNVRKLAKNRPEVLAAALLPFIESCIAAGQQGAETFDEWMDRDWPLWWNDPGNPNVARCRRVWGAARANPSPVADALVIEPTHCTCHPETCPHGDYTLSIGETKITDGSKAQLCEIAAALGTLTGANHA